MTHDFDEHFSFPNTELHQAIADTIESIAMESASLGEIISTENELLKKAGKESDIPGIVSANESVRNMLESIAVFQGFIQYELENAKTLLESADGYDDGEELEE